MQLGIIRNPLFLVLLLVSMVLAPFLVFASSGWGHMGQSIYLFAIEMPQKAVVYKSILGDDLFARLTCEVSPNNYRFDFDNLNKAQKAFIAGVLGPDKHDINYFLGIGWPVHEKNPQKVLNFINDFTNQEKGEDLITARAFFFGWSFHYITDLVVHTGMNKGNALRMGREYSEHGPQHGIFEGLTDRLSINYWFLKYREKGISPSRVIESAGKLKQFGCMIREIPNHWDQFKDKVKIGLKEFGQVVKGVYAQDHKSMSSAVKDARDKIKFIKEALYDKSLKAFFADGIPEAEILSGRARLNDFLSEDLENPPPQEGSGSPNTHRGLPQGRDLNNPVVRSAISEGIQWWKEIMANTPSGFRHALQKDGFSCNIDYGRDFPTPEPDMGKRSRYAVKKIYNSAMGR